MYNIPGIQNVYTLLHALILNMILGIHKLPTPYSLSSPNSPLLLSPSINFLPHSPPQSKLTTLNVLLGFSITLKKLGSWPLNKSSTELFAVLPKPLRGPR